MSEFFLNGAVELRPGDCRDVLRTMPDNSVDSVVTDPPYALVSIAKRFGKKGSAKAKGDVYARASSGFMGKDWDTGETVFAVEFWSEVFRVLKPGGHVLAFSGTRTYHRMAVAIEDAGFEIRDMIGWLYGSGFPKSHDVSKGIDKAAGVVRETAPATPEAAKWQGWGTALKPAQEPICMARKPLIGTVAQNVLKHGTGALNIDEARIETAEILNGGGAYADAGGRVVSQSLKPSGMNIPGKTAGKEFEQPLGRWPANIIHDGSGEVVSSFPDSHIGGSPKSGNPTPGSSWNIGGERSSIPGGATYGDSGSASRFFYTAKADGDDRLGSKHPTVKPLDLMQYLVRLVTPPGGLVLDPFAGTGSTGEAAWREGMRAVLVERDEEYLPDIRKRMAIAPQHSASRKIAAAKPKPADDIGQVNFFGDE